MPCPDVLLPWQHSETARRRVAAQQLPTHASEAALLQPVWRQAAVHQRRRDALQLAHHAVRRHAAILCVVQQARDAVASSAKSTPKGRQRKARKPTKARTDARHAILPGDTHAAVLAHPRVRAALAERLASHQHEASGSATCIRRILPLTDALRFERGEVTDKGSINQRAVLAQRSALVEALYADAAGVIQVEVFAA